MRGVVDKLRARVLDRAGCCLGADDLDGTREECDLLLRMTSEGFPHHDCGRRPEREHDEDTERGDHEEGVLRSEQLEGSLGSRFAPLYETESLQFVLLGVSAHLFAELVPARRKGRRKAHPYARHPAQSRWRIGTCAIRTVLTVLSNVERRSLRRNLLLV